MSDREEKRGRKERKRTRRRTERDRKGESMRKDGHWSERNEGEIGRGKTMEERRE